MASVYGKYTFNSFTFDRKIRAFNENDYEFIIFSGKFVVISLALLKNAEKAQKGKLHFMKI